MKVEQKHKEFQPITITLETEFEARVLKTLVGNILDHNKFRMCTSEFYNCLDNLRIREFDGDIPNISSSLIDLES